MQTAYAIWMKKLVSVNVECFATESQPMDIIQAYVEDSCDLTPMGIIGNLHLLDVDYHLVSACEHLGMKGLPWEE